MSDPSSGAASEQDAAPENKLDVLNPGGEHARLGARDFDRDRTFKISMTLAALLHAALFISLIHGYKPRSIGNPAGSSEAISVSILSEKDLKSRAAVEDAANPQREGPVAPVPPLLKPTVEAPPPEPDVKPVEEPPPPEPTPEPPKEEPKPDAEAAEPAPQTDEVPEFETKTEKAEEKAEKQAAIAPPAPTTADEALKNLLENTDPLEATKRKTEDAQKKEKEKAAKPTTPAKPDPKAQRQQTPDRPQAVPDIAMPGGGAGVQRPPGYTKSGENDAFARGVIRALQRTMPQLRNTFGIVTVRIDIDQNGNLAKVTVLKPSGVAGLDQSVAFAVQQSSFPLPPANATVADLTFFVRYVYN